MRLYNPTLDVIEDKCMNFIYIVGPDQETSVSDTVGAHMITRKGKYGLVTIDYGTKEEKEFGSLQNFKKIKKKEGLEAYRTWIQQCLNQERMFPREVTHKNGGEVELATTKIPYFEKKLKEIEGLLNTKVEEIKEIKPFVKRGRPFMKKSPIIVGNVNVEQVTA